MGEVRLPGDRAKRGEFRAGEADKIGRIGMRVGDPVEDGVLRPRRDRRLAPELRVFHWERSFAARGRR